MSRKRKNEVAGALPVPTSPAADKPSVWQALNEPVVAVSPEFAKHMLVTAAVFLMVAWLSPYWGYSQTVEKAYDFVISYETPHSIVAGAMAYEDSNPTDFSPYIRGGEEGLFFNQFIYEMSTTSQGVTEAFSKAAYQVLDISPTLQTAAEFYGPGFEQVVMPFWNSWLELMVDPI